MTSLKSRILTSVGSLLFCFTIIEIFLRVAVAFDLGGLRTPEMFLNPLSQDIYWKTRLVWSDFAEAPLETIDPEFGWLPLAAADNPHALILADGQTIDYAEPAVLFYGDSYVHALTAPEDAIPQQMDALLDTPVQNLGVLGFGVGQIYLRLRKTAPEFEQPILLFGILTFDLDRTVLNVRSGPKPRVYFDEAGEMQVANTPFDQRVDEWIAEHPPRMWSYFGRFLIRNFQLIQAARAGDAFGVEDRVEEKMRVNGQIMDHAATHAAENGWPMAFVIFYSRGEFDNDSWREPFLRDMCQQHTCIDTKIALKQAVESSGRPVAAFYLDDGLHLNPEGNRLVAEYIVSEMEKLELIR